MQWIIFQLIIVSHRRQGTALDPVPCGTFLSGSRGSTFVIEGKRVEPLTDTRKRSFGGRSQADDFDFGALVRSSPLNLQDSLIRLVARTVYSDVPDQCKQSHVRKWRIHLRTK